MTSTRLIIFNFVAFQLLWWACVLSAKGSWETSVFCLIILLVLLHIQWVEGWQQALPLLLTAVSGCIFDQVMYRMGYVDFGTVTASYIPSWMIGLWFAFACTLNVSMRWLQGKPWLAVVLGFIFGPLAYLAAESLGAVQLTGSTLTLAWIALEWAIALPVLLWIRVFFNANMLTKPL